MVSAVHRDMDGIVQTVLLGASKGLHMVSAVHPVIAHCNTRSPEASKGLHMVSAVHL